MPYDINGEPYDYTEPPSLSETTREIREMKSVSALIVIASLLALFFLAAGVVMLIGAVING